ncbi:hypothetical protein C5167_008522 [Papaver somniferum]|uniref:Uncharacterized protein n=1 Tax=Papaver somniferum TaxID=3469 RepID=A0A4Y7JXW2_PAPSO|nr:hypothetical protein C5167_008522 [Papaver somniferum]
MAMFLSELMNIHSNGRMISVFTFRQKFADVLLLFYLHQIHWGISHFEVFFNMFLSKLRNIHTNARIISEGNWLGKCTRRRHGMFSDFFTTLVLL